MEAFWQAADALEKALDAGTSDIDARLAKLRASYVDVPDHERKRARVRGKQLSERVRNLKAQAANRDWSNEMANALAQVGLDTFREGQADVIEHVLRREDCLVVIPTGGGKSLCYQVPSQIQSGMTVVVSPLIALMQDQQARMSHLGAVMLTSAQSDIEREAALEQVKAGKAKILFVAPERFSLPSFMRLLKGLEISLFVVDEAHCLSEMGHDFRPDYLRLAKALGELGRPPVLALTATATPAIAREITSRLRLRDPFVYHGGFDRPNITFDVVTLGGTGSMKRKDLILVEGLKRSEMVPAIVYCGTRKDTERVAELVQAQGLNAAAYHAGLDSAARSDAQRLFMTGQLDVVCATNAFGMGVDKADVRSVWHYALPSSIEAYYQEAGRAGRDGLPAHAVLLAMRADLGRLINFNKRRQIEMHQVESMIRRISRMTDGAGHFQAAIHEDSERVIIGIMERVGALEIIGASRDGIEGKLMTEQLDPEQAHGVEVAIQRAVNMGWSAYRAIEAYSTEDEMCRRKQILEHFSDEAKVEPIVRCCDVHEPAEWLIEITPAVDEAMRSSKSSGGSRYGSATGASTKFEDIAGDVDQILLSALRDWRSERCGDKPPYTVCNNNTLAEIARLKPTSDEELLSIKGIGPSFVEKHAESLREVLSAQ